MIPPAKPKSTSVGIPGIPMGALAAVSDANVRAVLQALVDGTNVRNGFAGVGDYAFITRAEFNGSMAAGGASNRIGNIASTPSAGGVTGGKWTGSDIIQPGQVAQAISLLQQQIYDSVLFKTLESRIDLIDKPDGILNQLQALFTGQGTIETSIINETQSRQDGDSTLLLSLNALGTRVGTSETGLINEMAQRVAADSAQQTYTTIQFASVGSNLALVQTQTATNADKISATTTMVTQLQATVAGQSAAVQQAIQAGTDALAGLYAQYTLRVDVAGHVSGFGLASSSTFSDFIVEADRFSIVGTPVQGGLPQIPFIVTTSTEYINGQTVPPGVYISDAFIANGTIDYAKIGVAEIGTLLVQGNAITVPLYAETGYVGTFGPGASPATVASVAGYFGVAMPAMVMGSVQASNPHNDETHVRIRILMDGWSVILDRSISAREYWNVTQTVFGGVNVPSGSHSFQLQLGNDATYSGGPWDALYSALLVLGVAR